MGAACGGENTGGPELDYREVGDVDQIRERFVQAGQGHVFNAWDDMDEEERARLIQQCTTFDVNLINELY